MLRGGGGWGSRASSGTAWQHDGFVFKLFPFPKARTISLKSIRFPFCALRCQRIHRSASRQGSLGLCKHRAKPNVALPVEEQELRWLEVKGPRGSWAVIRQERRGAGWKKATKSRKLAWSFRTHQNRNAKVRPAQGKATCRISTKPKEEFHALRGRTRSAAGEARARHAALVKSHRGREEKRFHYVPGWQLDWKTLRGEARAVRHLMGSGSNAERTTGGA